MSGSQSQAVPLEEEFQPFCVQDKESSLLPAGSSPAAAEVDDIEYYTLSGKNPYFAVILRKSSVTTPYQLILRKEITEKLPSAKIPVGLTSLGKRWTTLYRGDEKRCKRFDRSWRAFAVDNDLKAGDCCFFELMDCSTTKLEFKVIILRCVPSSTVEEAGATPDTAIFIE